MPDSRAPRFELARLSRHCSELTSGSRFEAGPGCQTKQSAEAVPPGLHAEPFQGFNNIARSTQGATLRATGTGDLVSDAAEMSSCTCFFNQLLTRSLVKGSVLDIEVLPLQRNGHPLSVFFFLATATPASQAPLCVGRTHRHQQNPSQSEGVKGWEIT
eukprot:gene1334-32691_t